MMIRFSCDDTLCNLQWKSVWLKCFSRTVPIHGERRPVYPSILSNLVPLSLLLMPKNDGALFIIRLEEQSTLWKFGLEDVCSSKATFILAICNTKWPRDGYVMAKTCPDLDLGLVDFYETAVPTELVDGTSAKPASNTQLHSHYLH